MNKPTTRELRHLLTALQIDADMTVAELRHALFAEDEQDAEVGFSTIARVKTRATETRAKAVDWNGLLNR